MSFGSKLETIGKDVLKAVTKPFTFLAKTEKVLDTVITDQPVLKTLLTQTVVKSEQIAVDGLAAGGSKGMNLVADAQVLNDAEQFFVWFKNTVVPEIEKVYGEISTDVKAPVA